MDGKQSFATRPAATGHGKKAPLPSHLAVTLEAKAKEVAHGLARTTVDLESIDRGGADQS